jgi:hypothetical protein
MMAASPSHNLELARQLIEDVASCDRANALRASLTFASLGGIKRIVYL